MTRIRGGKAEVLANKLACPPVNVGVRSTPNYSALARAAVHPLDGGWVFAGQRREGFYVDLGSIFDLGVLRPFQNAHLIPLPAVGGVDSSKHLNVHTIAIQIPKTHLTPGGVNPTDPAAADSVIGVYTSASRRKSTVLHGGHQTDVGPWVQVSRLGMPLINEVVITKKVVGANIGKVMKRKDFQPVAPSTRAASYNGRGMFCKPVRKITRL